ncbi:unnamed protein product, partial [Iphiclides podalirius]
MIQEPLGRSGVTMRLFNIIAVVLVALLLLCKCDARPTEHKNHVQKRASWCLLKLCSYQPTPHRVQKLR